jgi:hypothetical protein
MRDRLGDAGGGHTGGECAESHPASVRKEGNAAQRGSRRPVAIINPIKDRL